MPVLLHTHVVNNHLSNSVLPARTAGILREGRIGASYSTRTASPGSHHTPKKKNRPDTKVLLLEGDVLAVSQEGIARTGYRLLSHLPIQQQPGMCRTRCYQPLAIEEFYDLKHACKKYFFRCPTNQRTSQSPPTRYEEETTKSVFDPSSTVVLDEQSVGTVSVVDTSQNLSGCLEIQEIDPGQVRIGSEDRTGATTWESSIAMGLFFTAHHYLLHGHVIELGCGVGLGQILTQLGVVFLAGPAAAAEETTMNLGLVKSVTLTDGNEQVLDQCRKNLQNALALSDFQTISTSLPPFYVKELNWNLASQEGQKYDTVIACDVVYLPSQINPIIHAFKTLLSDNGHVHIFGPYNRGALQQVCRTLSEEQDFDINLEFIELERYRLPPTYGEDCFDQDFSYWRAYESKSKVTFLHATAHRRNSYDMKYSSLINDLD